MDVFGITVAARMPEIEELNDKDIGNPISFKSRELSIFVICKLIARISDKLKIVICFALSAYL